MNKKESDIVDPVVGDETYTAPGVFAEDLITFTVIFHGDDDNVIMSKDYNYIYSTYYGLSHPEQSIPSEIVGMELAWIFSNGITIGETDVDRFYSWAIIIYNSYRANELTKIDDSHYSVDVYTMPKRISNDNGTGTATSDNYNKKIYDNPYYGSLTTFSEKYEIYHPCDNVDESCGIDEWNDAYSRQMNFVSGINVITTVVYSSDDKRTDYHTLEFKHEHRWTGTYIESNYYHVHKKRVKSITFDFGEDKYTLSESNKEVTLVGKTLGNIKFYNNIDASEDIPDIVKTFIVPGNYNSKTGGNEFCYNNVKFLSCGLNGTEGRFYVKHVLGFDNYNYTTWYDDCTCLPCRILAPYGYYINYIKLNDVTKYTGSDEIELLNDEIGTLERYTNDGKVNYMFVCNESKPMWVDYHANDNSGCLCGSIEVILKKYNEEPEILERLTVETQP